MLKQVGIVIILLFVSILGFMFILGKSLEKPPTAHKTLTSEEIKKVETLCRKKQEDVLSSLYLSRGSQDDTKEIERFVKDEVRSGKFIENCLKETLRSP